MKQVLMTSAFWLAAILLGLQVLGRSSDSSVLAAGPAPSVTPTPAATPVAPGDAIEKMRQHMDAMMGTGSFDRMYQAMGADADAMMAACASAMESSSPDSMNNMMNGSMGGMMNQGGMLGNGMMGR